MKKAMSPHTTTFFFFTILAILFLFFTKYTLLPLHIRNHFPLFKSICISLICSTLLAFLFGNLLVKPKAWWKSFLLGAGIAIGVLFISSLFALFYSQFPLAKWQDYFVIFGSIFVSFTLIFGIWLILLLGLASIYFNTRFYPRLNAIYMNPSHDK
jgi:hypothetical protein